MFAFGAGSFDFMLHTPRPFAWSSQMRACIHRTETVRIFWVSFFIVPWRLPLLRISAGLRHVPPAAGFFLTARETAPNAGALLPFAATAPRRVATTSAEKRALTQGRLHARLYGLERLGYWADLLGFFG